MSRLYSSVLLILVFCYAVTSQESSDIWKSITFLNCAPNDEQMSLVRMYFSRVTLIESIELLSVHGQTTRFASSLVKLLSTSNIPVTYIVDTY